MGSCTEAYDPSKGLEEPPEQVRVVETETTGGVDGSIQVQEGGVVLRDGGPDQVPLPPVQLARHFDRNVSSEVGRHHQWLDLKDPLEWSRLQGALIRLKGKKKDGEQGTTTNQADAQQAPS